MTEGVRFLNADGTAMRARKALALANGNNVPYDAADNAGQHMAAWQPYLWSPDGELNMYRDRIVSRVRDMVRNDGWASGGVSSILDNAIGASFRPIAKPDHRALLAWSGNKGFDPVWADEFGQAVEARYRGWADDIGKWCDVTRNQTIAQIMYLAFRHYLVDGDAIALLPWLPQRVGQGRAAYSTAVQLIDPDRLSNPQLNFDQQALRGGVEVDDWGAAVAYHIRKAHQGDWFSAAKSVMWERVPRETSWGRPVVIHFFDLDRAGQHRGGAGILTPILQRLKMLVKYDTTELDASIINAIFAAYITSPFDRQLVEEAVTEDPAMPAYQAGRAEFHKDNRTMLGAARIPILYPGESINTVTATRPNSNFEGFEAAVLRNAAAGMGTSYEQLSRDWSRTNYSSGRLSLIEVWKTLHRRRTNFSTGFAGPMYSAWLEESMEVDKLPMPSGQVPDFMECRTAYSRARWQGPGKGYVDPVKERQGAVLGIEAGLSTLESEAAEQGRDWEDDLAQRKVEIERYREAGVPLPGWARMSVDYEDKPEQESGGAPS